MDISSLVIGAIGGTLVTYTVTRFLFNENIREQKLADAIIDPDTGLYTRHYMNEIASRLVAMHRRDEKAGFAISLVEITDESIIISQHGEEVFNRAFAFLATLVMETIRETDLAIRFSSNRVAIISDCNNQKAARQTLYRINEKISHLEIPITKEKNIKLITSATQVIHEAGESFSELLNRTESILLGSNRP
jgi:diguanylate cyclase (GGDEF)-like protein